MKFTEEQTDTLYIAVTTTNDCKEHITEVFIKEDGFIWHSVLRYNRLPRKSLIIRDCYAHKCKSPRPYKAGQACDGSITAPAYHLYNQLCIMMGFDPVAIYNEAYDDCIFTQDQLTEILKFAEWQGVEVIYNWTQEKIDLVLESIHEVNMHQLANVLVGKMPV